MEIKARSVLAKEAFSNRKKLLTKKFQCGIKKRIVKTLVWSVALHAAETWTIRTEERRRVEALEMWIWRRMNKIKWTDQKTNDEVLEKIGKRRKILDVIVQRKKNWIGHVMREERAC